MNTDRYDDDRGPAVADAQAGAESWRAVVQAQRSATPDHSDWYAITGEMVDTLRCLAAVASIFAQQVDEYGRGRVLRDDAGVDPMERLAVAASLADTLRQDIDRAEHTTNRFWSEIGHIAVGDPS